jgi:hypothetical protein
VRRVVHPVIPPHVDYSLTPAGEQVSERVEALADWIELAAADPAGPRGGRPGGELPSTPTRRHDHRCERFFRRTRRGATGGVGALCRSICSTIT